jgi:phospholipase C
LLDAGVITDFWQLEPGLLAPGYYDYLPTGGTGLTDAYTGPSTRIPNVLDLPEGAFQLTPYVAYDACTNSPVHRFYPMWQQQDCGASLATVSNPAGCLHDLFSWLEVGIGAGDNGLPQPNPFNHYSTGEGSTSMEFRNVQQGDAPYLKFLADNYTLSDNRHQAATGGTGMNHNMLGFADEIWFSDNGNGNTETPITAQIELRRNK